MKINLERLKNRIMTLAEVGKDPEGGITRLAYSDEYYEGIKLVKSWMDEAGLKAKIDTVGNVIGVKRGDSEKIILVGSHTDTVEHGGAFDGVLGVLGAIEVAQTLKEQSIKLHHTLVLGNWAEEEGNVVKGLVGSGAFVGGIDDQIESIKDKLSKFGITPEDVKNARFDRVEDIEAYLELHIEQGGLLENMSVEIGVVSGIVGEERYLVSVLGKENHAGTTPMQYRDDALVKAAKIILQLNEKCTQLDETMVCTVGKIQTFPGEQNIIPGRVDMTVEIRAASEDSIHAMVDYMKAVCGDSCKITKTLDQNPTHMSKICMDAIQASCEELNLTSRVMQSGAGHDAMMIANSVRNTGMIFVPSVGGLSHCPQELTRWRDVENGVNTLLGAVLKLDKMLMTKEDNKK